MLRSDHRRRSADLRRLGGGSDLRSPLSRESLNSAIGPPGPMRLETDISAKISATKISRPSTSPAKAGK
jgi:hypothetical protein